jgi:hypothetical protein
VRRAGLVVLVVVGSMVAGCAKAEIDQGTPRAKAPTTTAASSTTARSTEDFVAQAEDFVNLHDMTAVRGFFVANRKGHLAEALAIARANEGGTYPVGTIIQLFPQEAMVKRRAGFDPRSNDWEFFELDPSKTGTVIHQRGGAEIVNRFGSGSCSGCHRAADPKFDFVCEETHGCDPLPFGRPVIDSFQEADPRPRKAGS